MMYKYVGISLLVAGVSLSGAAFSEEAHHPHWGYSGETGPAHWGETDPKNVTCSTGKNQTPVDLDTANMIDAKLPPLVTEYQADGGTQTLNNGHTVQVVYEPGSKIKILGKEFELKQFHFHEPSENAVDGKLHAMEAHFVHADKDGNLAVIGLLYDEGKESAELQKAWAHLPTKEDSEKQALPKALSAKNLLPKNLEYYMFSGSLTTPPCTEGVLWIVLKHHMTVSKEQLEVFKHLMHDTADSRPLQPLNSRVILK